MSSPSGWGIELAQLPIVASGTFDKPYITVVRAVMPWLGLSLIALAIVTYVPEISLWLPKQLYPGIR